MDSVWLRMFALKRHRAIYWQRHCGQQQRNTVLPDLDSRLLFYYYVAFIASRRLSNSSHLMLFPTFILLLVLPVHGQRQSSVADYAPITNGNCPDITNTKFVREWTPTTQGLHPGEQTYIQTRNSTVIQDAWQSWIGDASQLGYTFSSLAGHFPLVGLSLPGGGLRASLFGAAALNALDSRNQTSKAAGTGGLLQVASYLTGLSGRSFPSCYFTLTLSRWIMGRRVFCSQ